MQENTETNRIRFEAYLAVVLFLLIIATGVVFYHVVEGLSWLDAFYFTSMTLTTVGYGDFAPQTDVGKLFTAFYVYIGIAMFFGIATLVFRGFMNRLPRRRKK